MVPWYLTLSAAVLACWLLLLCRLLLMLLLVLGFRLACPLLLLLLALIDLEVGLREGHHLRQHINHDQVL